MRGIPEIPAAPSSLAHLLPVLTLLGCLVAEHFGSLGPLSESEGHSPEQVSFSSTICARHLFGRCSVNMC